MGVAVHDDINRAGLGRSSNAAVFMHKQKPPAPETELARARQQLCIFFEGAGQPHAFAVIVAEHDFHGAAQLLEIKYGERRYHVAGMHHQAYTALVEHINRLLNGGPVVMGVCNNADKIFFHGCASLAVDKMAAAAQQILHHGNKKTA
jgi:hypothetical protein